MGARSWPSLAFNGTEFGLAWTGVMDGHPEVYFVRLSASGAKLGDESRVTLDPAGSEHPKLVWNGTEYGLISTAGWYRLRFQRLSRDGQPIGDPVTLSSHALDWHSSLAATSTGFGVVWTDTRDQDNEEIYFQRIAGDGTLIGDSVRVTSAPAESEVPSLVWSGSEFAVAWDDARFGHVEVFFARLDSEGSKLGDDVRVTYAPDPENRKYPALVWSGREYGIVAVRHIDFNWRLYLYRLSPTGQPIQEETDFGPCAGSGPSIAWSGSEYGIAFPTSYPLYIAFTRAGFEDAPDADGDGFRTCRGDCDDGDDTVWPGASEVCDRQDNDCDGSTDEDANGEDPDSDGHRSACDNCPLSYNLDQLDIDSDSRGNACDNCLAIPNVDQVDLDSDGRGDACDNCRASYNPFQDDTDGDHIGDVCDNCLTVRNESQHDANSDREGDECDVNDGTVIFRPIGHPRVRWQSDPVYSTYNLYRGSLTVLRATGEYTQQPGSNPYADRFCSLAVTYQDDGLVPSTGDAFYWLVTGVGVGGEEPLGDGAGVDRPNAHPCP